MGLSGLGFQRRNLYGSIFGVADGRFIVGVLFWVAGAGVRWVVDVLVFVVLVFIIRVRADDWDFIGVRDFMCLVVMMAASFSLCLCQSFNAAKFGGGRPAYL